MTSQPTILAALRTAGGWHSTEELALRLGNGVTREQVANRLYALAKKGQVVKRVTVAGIAKYRAEQD